uniref:DRBM domain-containing protein n=1 Tax=Panagrellus redivivus TaxID=6233 RepID=A0A7E4W1Z2_PANRE
MEKTPIALLNDTLNKLHVRPVVNITEAPGNSFATNIVATFANGRQLEAAGIGPSKKASHHAAAAKLLLKVLENGGVFPSLKAFQKFREEMCSVNASHFLLHGFGKTSMLGKKDPIGSLITVCHHNNFNPPAFIFSDEVLSFPQHFWVTCKVEIFETTADGNSKQEARVRAADAMLQLFMKWIRGGREATDDEYDMDKMKRMYFKGHFVGNKL